MLSVVFFFKPTFTYISIATFVSVCYLQEKDDLDARFREVSETAERASSQHSSMQLDLERTRQQANEALKAMDAERQQLRSANNKYITLT